MKHKLKPLFELLPKYESSLYISHNPHKAFYETIEVYISNRGELEGWISEDHYWEAVRSDSLWEVQWYPDTPIGSYIAYGNTLEEALTSAKQYKKES